MSETSEQTAEKIAARGREALIARLRPAFEEAAAAHADVLDLSPEQIEEMIQRAADRADGLQWRRALAAVATEELGITLGEALSHPDVIRAHELVGAPSYEDSLAELSAPIRPAPSAESANPVPEAELPEAAADPELPDTTAADAELPDAAPATEVLADSDSDDDTDADTDPGEAALGPADPEAPLPGLEPPGEPDDDDHDDDDTDEALAATDDPIAGIDQPTVEYDVDEWDDDEYYEPDGLRMAVVHLGGIANLEPAEKDIELLMSDEGLDIIRNGHDVLGRLDWEHVKALEVPPPRGRRRMRKPTPTHLVIRTARGDASFEVPEVTPEELREHLAPVIAEHLHGL